MSDQSDSVVVRIAANVEELVAGMQEAASVVQEAMEQIKVAIEAVSLAVVGGELFEHLIEKTAETGVQLEIMATKTGATVEALSQLTYAANLSHVSTEELSIGVQRLARNMEEATKSATTPAAEAFKALGIQVVGANGALRPIEDVITEVAQRFAEMADGTGKTALAMDLFGRSGANLIPFLNEGAEGIRRLREESDKLGNTWSKDDVEAAVQYEDAIKRLQAAWSGLVREFGVAVFPILEKIAQAFEALIFLTEAFVYASRAAALAVAGAWKGASLEMDKAREAVEKALHAFDDPRLEAPVAGGGKTPPLPHADKGPTQLERWREEWNKRKEAALGGDADLLFLEITFWQKKLQLAEAGSKEYIEIHTHLVELETQLQKRSTEEQAKELKKLQEEWIKTAEAIPKAWDSAVRDWKKGGESMLDFWRDLMRQLIAEAAAASVRMIIIHNAEWLEKKKQIIEGHALEVAQSAWSMLKVVADYAAKAAAAAWSAMAGIPFVGPALGVLAAAATFAGVMALATHGGGGGGAGAAPSAAGASVGGGASQTVYNLNVNTMDATSFQNFAMKNAVVFAKAAAAGASQGMLTPGAPGRTG